MNKGVLENKKKFLIAFCNEFGIEIELNYDFNNFILNYEKQQLQASKQRVKEAKSALISEINNTVFSEIKAEMAAKNMKDADLARAIGRKHQQIWKMFKVGRANTTTIDKLKKAIESWKNN